MAIPPATDPNHRTPTRLALVIIADPVLRAFCGETLRKSGLTVTDGIESGAEALLWTRELHPDVILLSHQLSDVPAHQAVRWLRSNRESIDTPIIVVGGRASDASKETGVTVLPRPVAADSLWMAVAEALRSNNPTPP